MTLALAALFTMGGMTVLAQNASQDRIGDKKECCKKDCKNCEKKCNKKDVKKCDKKEGKKCNKKKGGSDKKAGKKDQSMLFNGLNLTSQQQTAIAQIPTPAAVMKAARDGKKDNQGEQMSKEMRKSFAKNVRLDYLKSIKGVLSADQYVQFLENFYTDASAMKPGKGQGHKMKGDKKKFDKKNMGDKKKDGRQGKDRAERRADKK